MHTRLPFALFMFIYVIVAEGVPPPLRESTDGFHHRHLQGSGIALEDIESSVTVFCQKFLAAADGAVLSNVVSKVCSPCDATNAICRAELDEICLDDDPSGICYIPEIDEAVTISLDGNASIDRDLLIKYQGDYLGLVLGLSIRESDGVGAQSCQFSYQDEICDCNPNCQTGAGFGGISINCPDLQASGGVNNECNVMESNEPFGFPPSLIRLFATLHDALGGLIDEDHDPDDVAGKFPNCETEFSDELSDYSYTSLQCPVCNSAFTVCDALLEEQCLRTGLCYEIAIQETVKTVENGVDFAFEVAVQYSGTTNGFRFLKRIAAPGGPTESGHTFHWNEHECAFCDGACPLDSDTASTENSNGISVNCSNLDVNAVVPCSRIGDNGFLPDEVIELFSTLDPPTAETSGDGVGDSLPEEEILDCEQSFGQGMEDVKDKIDTLTCSTCDTSQSVCTMISVEECLPSNSSICYVTQVTETVDYGASSTATIDLTVSYRGDGSNSIRLVEEIHEKAGSEKEECRFYWNDRRCRTCTLDCSDKPIANGIGVDCTNIDGVVALDCVAFEHDQLLPQELIQTFAIASKPVYQQICEDFTQSIDTGACAVCREDMIQCEQTVFNKKKCSTTAYGETFCYRTATAATINLEDGWVEEIDTVDYSEGAQWKAALRVKSKFRQKDLSDAEFDSCSFVIDNEACQTCTSCDADAEAVTIDCSNLFSRNVRATCLNDVALILQQIPLSASGSERNAKWVHIVVFFLLFVAFVSFAKSRSPASDRSPRRRRGIGTTIEVSHFDDIRGSDAVLT